MVVSFIRERVWIRSLPLSVLTQSRTLLGKLETLDRKRILATSPARIMSEFSNPNLEPLITGEAIQARIRELGAEISRDYAGRNPLLIGVLKGAFIFLK